MRAVKICRKHANLIKIIFIVTNKKAHVLHEMIKVEFFFKGRNEGCCVYDMYGKRTVFKLKLINNDIFSLIPTTTTEKTLFLHFSNQPTTNQHHR
jgi:hypothetical protein